MSEPTITCYRCRSEIKPRVIAQAMPGFSDYETRDYWCDKCGPLAYWTVKIERVRSKHTATSPSKSARPGRKRGGVKAAKGAP